MVQGRRVQKIFESKPEGSGRGGPRLRWMEEVEKNLRETKVKRWRQKAVDREKWAAVIRDAKALRQGVSSLRTPSDIVISREPAVPIHVTVIMVFTVSVTAMCFDVPPLHACLTAPQTKLFLYH